jgi:hypothetical protein
MKNTVKYVLPSLSPTSRYYTEWHTTQDNRAYCIIQEGNVWTLLHKTELGAWLKSAFDIDLFLDYYKLALVEP